MEFFFGCSGNAILEVSYIGYESQTVHVADKTQFSFILKEDTEVLEDVVVIGYGSVKKSNLTGAVASVKMEEVLQTATTEVSNLLIGRVPGLSIRQNSAAPDGDYKWLFVVLLQRMQKIFHCMLLMVFLEGILMRLIQMI